MKRLLSFFALIFISLSLNAATGFLSGEKDIRVAKTKWFDIIYPQRCQLSAGILYEKADQIYQEVTAQYGWTPSVKMPVVITPSVERFNAFWTAVPYNHIVIYDTSVTRQDDLNVFSETLLSTFRHELTHAVTYNAKNGFWKFISSVFGDAASLGILNVTTGMAEGATVTSESADGEGRLNDEFARHFVKQAKIEGRFPSYYDVTGAGDAYPSGAAYYFNGAFHQWLQKMYGLEAYGNFWYAVINVERPTTEWCFKKVYKISIKEAWKLFEASYEVPEIAANPVEAGQAIDFFDKNSQFYSKRNSLGLGYKSLTASDKWIAWIEGTSSKIQYLEKSDFYSGLCKPENLATINGIEKIQLSKDSRLMAITYYSDSGSAVKSRVKIYDTETKKYFSVKQSGLKDAAIIKNGADYFLLADKYESQNNKIYIGRLDFSKGKISNLVETQVINNQHIICSNFEQFTKDQFVCIKKDGMKYSLVVYDLDGRKIREIRPAKNIVIRSLSYSHGELLFSWASSSSLPRIGRVKVEDGSFENLSFDLSRDDISGGIFEPLALEDSVLYIGKFYDQRRLLLLERDRISFEQVATENAASVEAPSQSALKNIPSEKYNAVTYLKRGIFVPLSLYKTEYFGPNFGISTAVSQYLLGFTYITANPWTEGTSDLFTLTSGWNYLNNSVGVEFTANHGSSTSLFSSTIDIKNEFDRKGWKLSFGKLTLSTVFPLGNISYAGFTNEVEVASGRQDNLIRNLTMADEFNFNNSDYFEIIAARDYKVYRHFRDAFTVKYSNIHSTGSGRFEKAGILAATGISYVDKNNIAAILILKGYLPKLIPVNCVKGLVYNLPSRLEFSVFPAESVYGYTHPAGYIGKPVYEAKFESILFGTEIQRAIPFFSSIYLNDFYISGGYAGTLGSGFYSKDGFQPMYLAEYTRGFMEGRGILYDSVYAKIVMELTPNIGLFASSKYKINVYGLFSYAFHNGVKQKFAWTIGTQANF